jgi:hypothetical protein
MDQWGKISGVPVVNDTYLVTFDLDDSHMGTPTYAGTLQLRVRPASDACDVWTEIGDGAREISTINAATDGPPEPLCGPAGDSQVEHDIWYCYIASCTGRLAVDLCDSDFDNKVAIYEGCGCPAGSGTALACDDDSCSSTFGALLDLEVTAGHAYSVRLGGSYRHERGSGMLVLSCNGDPAGACCLPGACSWTSEAECIAQGGEYLGEATVCEPDSDGDAVADACDGCPDDPAKTEPEFCGCGMPELNTDGDAWPDCIDPDDDGDGVNDDEDSAPLDRFLCGDFDGDGCEDCSSGGLDPTNDGPDADGDGVCHLTDCDDLDPYTFPGADEFNDGLDNQCPGDPGHGLVDEILDGAGFHNPLDKSEYSWPAQPGATEYEIARSPLRDLTGDCTLFYAPIAVFYDVEDPEPAMAFYYLVRAFLPHAGSWGRNSAGVERTWICP